MKIEKEHASGLEYLSKRAHCQGNDQSRKAIIMLHGYGASMHDLYGLSDVISVDSVQGSVDWIFPNGPQSVPLGMFMEGRAWFAIDMQQLESAMAKGEFRNFEDQCPSQFLDSLLLVKKFVISMLEKYDDVIIGGFSQGAMVTSHVVSELLDEQLNDHRFASKVKGFILYSSALLAKEKLINALEKTRPKPFMQSHGKSDMLLDYNGARVLFELLKLNRFEGEFISFDGGHEIPMNVLKASGEFINKVF